MTPDCNTIVSEIEQVDGLPGWLPDPARHYLAHIGAGVPIRALARGAGVHASTILRQVRRTELRRDDPLVDAAFRSLEACLETGGVALSGEDILPMQAKKKPVQSQDETQLLRDAARILGRLCEASAVLAVAADMEKAVVLRDNGSGGTARTAVTGSEVAAMMVIREWISTSDTGRIRRYAITAAGRAALRDEMGEGVQEGPGFADAQAAFAPAPAAPNAARRQIRYGVVESPIYALARRRGKDGEPFLSPDLVHAGERFREDFELSHIGEGITQNWDHFLTAGVQRGAAKGNFSGHGAADARARVAAALEELGPGLADVTLRCCCHLEGLECTEKKLGWSARSGKIVLRIALMRLKDHYAANLGPGGMMIG
ncbi:MAG: DUF6456 domain-containing protein [Sulfitobacter sp.]